jgi:hypothetical protein
VDRSVGRSASRLTLPWPQRFSPGLQYWISLFEDDNALKQNVLPPGGASYTEIRPWGEGSSYSWPNLTGKTGSFIFLVYVRDSRNGSTYETYKTIALFLGP